MSDELCACGHEAKYHGPKTCCRYPVAPRAEDCGCEAFRAQHMPQSDETTTQERP